MRYFFENKNLMYYYKMVYAKRSYKKRSYKKKKSYVPRRIKNIVPDSHMVKLKYVDTVKVNAGASAPNSYVFRANSIQDPDQTGTGHQPLGHDQWAPFYDHYTVVGAKITVRFMSILETAQGNAVVGILLKDNATVIVDPLTIMEETGSGYKVVTNADAKGTCMVSKGFSSKRFFGLQSIRDNRQLVGAAFGSNPTEEAYFHIYSAPIDPAVDPGVVDCVVTIEYTVLLTERKSLARS